MTLIIIGALFVVGSIFLAYATYWSFQHMPSETTLAFYNWFKKWIVQYRHILLFLLTFVILASGISMIVTGVGYL